MGDTDPQTYDSDARRVLGMDRNPYRSSDRGGDLQGGGGGGKYPPMEARVAKLEADMTEIKVLLGRIDERTSAMASSAMSKSDIAEMETRLVGKIGGVETRIGVAEGALSRTLGVWQFVGVMAAAVALITQWPKIAAAIGS